MKLKTIICLFALFISLGNYAQVYPKNQSNQAVIFEKKLENKGFIDVHKMDTSIRIDIKYATTDNFTKKVLYNNLTKLYLHPLAAAKLLKAHQYLKILHPHLRLLAYDGLRPLSIQKKMYQVVQNTPYAAYVANPLRTGLHNYGMAVDLTICNLKGETLDMGTPFDYFGKTAGISKEQELLKAGLLTQTQINNRVLLRKVMLKAGFLTIRGEWWHFNAVPLAQAKENYELIE